MSKNISGIIEIWHTIEKRINGKPSKDKEILVNNCYAEVLNLYGNELYSALNVDMQNMLIFKIRYSRKLEELLRTSDWKITYNNSTYDLYYANFSKEPYKYVYLKCKGSR